MAEAAFDTLAAARALKDAGVKPEHAEAIANAVREAANAGREELATKSDLAVFATKSDLAALELRLTNKLYAVAIGIAGVTIAAVKLIP